MAVTISRRAFTIGGIATMLGIPAVPLEPALAQGLDLTGLGLPTLDIGLSNVAYEHVPAEIEAGRYLVNVDVRDDVQAYIGTEFISPPPGMSALEFMMAMGIVAFPGIPAPTPENGGEGFPDFIYRTAFAGGPVGWPGSTAQAIVDLPPGEWIVLSDGEGATQPPAIINVSGEMPLNLPEPKADITATLVDFSIELEGDLTAGDHVVQLRNEGEEPHFLLLGVGPDVMTDDLVARSLEPGPGPNGFNLNTDVTTVMLSSTQSAGTEQWVPLTLEHGTYVGTCYFPATGGWEPHVNMGMHMVFTVD